MQAGEYHSIGDDSLIINLRGTSLCLKLCNCSGRQSRSVHQNAGTNDWLRLRANHCTRSVVRILKYARLLARRYQTSVLIEKIDQFCNVYQIVPEFLTRSQDLSFSNGHVLQSVTRELRLVLRILSY